jgi:RNA polymerase sigma-70 factor (ECF subfamily)
MSNVSSDRRISQDDFVALLVRHDRRVRSFISTLLARWDDVEDVLQSSCVVAWRKFDSFSFCAATPDEEFVRWLCTIARYEVLSLMRAQKIGHLVFDTELIDRLANIQLDCSPDLEDRHHALAKCIQRLRPRDREMTRQRYEFRVDIPELANRFSVGQDAIYKSLARIRSALMRCVELSMRREEA